MADHPFSCSVTELVIPPNYSAKVTVGSHITLDMTCYWHHIVTHTFLLLLLLQVTYKPVNVDTTSVDYFHISSISNISKLTVKCLGHSSGKFCNIIIRSKLLRA